MNYVYIIDTYTQIYIYIYINAFNSLTRGN